MEPKIILMRERFEDWKKLLMGIASKIGGENPEEVSKIEIEPNVLTIHYKTKGFR